MTDVLVLGTGVTGTNTIKYLQSHPDRNSFTFSIAGRSEAKLQSILDEISATRKEIPVHVVDVKNTEQIEAAVKSAKVVINTVGPYWLYGSLVVAACVRNGVHHVDLSGETHWVKDIIRAFDYAATKTGSIIVPSCGMDSVPSDITAYLGHKTISQVDENNPVGVGKSITAYKIAGVMSGGTASTAISMFESVPKNTLRWASDSYCLSQVIGIPSHSRRTFSLPLTFSSRTLVGATFPMTFINGPIVKRSWGLREYQNIIAPSPETEKARYGKDFDYEEFLVLPSKIHAFIFSIGYMITMMMLLIRPIRAVVKRLLPQSGEGPKTDEELHKGYLDVTNVTTSASGDVQAITTFEGYGDPGYYLSCIMLAECGLALLHPEKLSPVARQGGVLTTATVFGDELVTRLNRTGKFDIQSKIAKADETAKGK